MVMSLAVGWYFVNIILLLFDSGLFVRKFLYNILMGRIYPTCLVSLISPVYETKRKDYSNKHLKAQCWFEVGAEMYENSIPSMGPNTTNTYKTNLLPPTAQQS